MFRLLKQDVRKIEEKKLLLILFQANSVKDMVSGIITDLEKVKNKQIKPGERINYNIRQKLTMLIFALGLAQKETQEIIRLENEKYSKK